jgi:hypothetical protein
MIRAFVDYENIGSLEGLNISGYEKVFIFCGPRNTKIKFGALPCDGFCSMEFIGLTSPSSRGSARFASFQRLMGDVQ